MNILDLLQSAFFFVSVVVICFLLFSPTVIGFLMLYRQSNKENSQPNSIMRLDQLEENDSIIVEDVNAALEQIVKRLEAIEDTLEKEGSTVKGFRK